MAKKVFKKISVQTLPNGYSLSIEGNNFMYFNEQDLLAGFLVRVGSGNTDDMEMPSILNSLFSIMLGERYAKDVDQLNKTVNRLEAKFNSCIQKVEGEYARVKEKADQHDKMKKVLEETTNLVNDMRMHYQEACKPYDDYKKRISDLDNNLQKIESHFKMATTQADSMLKLVEDKLETATKTEKLLNSKARMLVERLTMRMENLPANDTAGVMAADAEETPDDDVLEVKASNSKPKKEKPAKTPKKTGRPKKNGGNTKTERQKRDEAIMEKLMNNPNIK